MKYQDRLLRRLAYDFLMILGSLFNAADLKRETICHMYVRHKCQKCHKSIFIYFLIGVS
jgi:hypothetical protein